MGTNVNKKNTDRDGSKLTFNWENKDKKQLVEALLSLQNANEVKIFLRDLMTETEINELSARLEAARLLSKNVQYNAIIKKTGLSSTTISRISKWLKGSLGGYKLILERIHHHNPIQMRKGLISS